MEDSIFSKIVRGEIPCHKIYEDDLTLAFLDIHPIQDGHTLVISKEQIEFVWDLPDDIYQAVMETSKKVALHMREVLPQTYVHQRIVGTDIPHAHVHLIPFDKTVELQVQQDEANEPDHQKLAALAEKLRFI